MTPRPGEKGTRNKHPRPISDRATRHERQNKHQSCRDCEKQYDVVPISPEKCSASDPAHRPLRFPVSRSPASEADRHDNQPCDHGNQIGYRIHSQIPSTMGKRWSEEQCKVAAPFLVKVPRQMSKRSFLNELFDQESYRCSHVWRVVFLDTRHRRKRVAQVQEPKDRTC